MKIIVLKNYVNLFGDNAVDSSIFDSVLGCYTDLEKAKEDIIADACNEYSELYDPREYDDCSKDDILYFLGKLSKFKEEIKVDFSNNKLYELVAATEYLYLDENDYHEYVQYSFIELE